MYRLVARNEEFVFRLEDEAIRLCRLEAYVRPTVNTHMSTRSSCPMRHVSGIDWQHRLLEPFGVKSEACTDRRLFYHTPAVEEAHTVVHPSPPLPSPSLSYPTTQPSTALPFLSPSLHLVQRIVAR